MLGIHKMASHMFILPQKTSVIDGHYNHNTDRLNF